MSVSLSLHKEERLTFLRLREICSYTMNVNIQFDKMVMYFCKKEQIIVEF